ncbi:MAG: hypothetical protein QOC96_3345 [Acidobacteriota bacterium]|jgi:hypothetical protein|nr:hypothetical protein [Acidobacteriota bacterium]
MSIPVQNNPPTQKRSRIVINLERARNAMHFHPHGQQPYGGKRRKWPIVLGIISIVLVGLVIGGYFYWQHYKTKPAYSLALVINAAQRNDAAAFDEVLDTDQVVQSFAPQMIDEASGRLGNALTPAMRQRVEALVPTLLSKVRDSVHDEVMRQVKEASVRAQGKPFFLVALFLPYAVDIKQNNDTATITAKTNDRNIELTMQRSSEQRWKIIAVKDPVLAKQLVDNIAKELPAIGSNIGDEVRKQIDKRLPGILSGPQGNDRGKHR